MSQHENHSHNCGDYHDQKRTTGHNMQEGYRKAIDELNRLNVTIRQRLEVAETFIPILNDSLAQLSLVRQDDEISILGDVIHQRAYSDGPADSAQIYHAAIYLPGGVGVVLRDMESCVFNEQNPHGRISATFMPFAQCTGVIKSMLLPQIHPMLERLFVMLRIQGP